VCPGAIFTRIWRRGAEVPDEMKKELGDVVIKLQPIKRIGLPIDIAEAVLWLASENARLVTGNLLVVDGGATLGFTPDSIQKISEDIREIYRRY